MDRLVEYFNFKYGRKSVVQNENDLNYVTTIEDV